MATQDEWEDIDEWEDVESEPAPLAQFKAPQISPIESAVLGAGKGASLGWLDELAAAPAALVDVAKRSDKSLSDFPELYARNKEAFREAMAASEAQNPNIALASEVGGSIVPGLIAPGAGSSLAARVAASAGMGGLAGAGLSEETEPSKLSADILKGVAFGGLAQGVGEGLGKVAGKGMEKIAQTRALQRLSEGLEGTAESLAARSLGAERGTIKSLGEKKVKEAGRYALESGIISPKLDTEAMIAKNIAEKQAAGKAIGEVYEAIDQRIPSGFNPLEVASEVESQLGSFWRSPLNRAETKQFENTLEAILMRGDKNLPLKEAQVLKEELGKAANWKNTLNITDKERMARDAYKIVSDQIDQAVESGAKNVGVEGLPEALTAAKSKYSTAKTAEKLLENKLAREQGNRLFGLTDVITGAGGLAMSPASALALVGAKKASERYGLQTAALGADKMSKVLKTAPERFGRYSKTLQDAAARGGHAMAVTHYLLNKSDPNYQAKIKELEEEDKE